MREHSRTEQSRAVRKESRILKSLTIYLIPSASHPIPIPSHPHPYHMHIPTLTTSLLYSTLLSSTLYLKLTLPTLSSLLSSALPYRYPYLLPFPLPVHSLTFFFALFSFSSYTISVCDCLCVKLIAELLEFGSQRFWMAGLRLWLES